MLLWQGLYQLSRLLSLNESPLNAPPMSQASMLVVGCRSSDFFLVSNPEAPQLCEAYSGLPASSEKPCEQVTNRPVCRRRRDKPRAGHRQPWDLRGSSAFHWMEQSTVLSCIDEK